MEFPQFLRIQSHSVGFFWGVLGGSPWLSHCKLAFKNAILKDDEIPESIRFESDLNQMAKWPTEPGWRTLVFLQEKWWQPETILEKNDVTIIQWCFVSMVSPALGDTPIISGWFHKKKQKTTPEPLGVEPWEQTSDSAADGSVIRLPLDRG